MDFRSLFGSRRPLLLPLFLSVVVVLNGCGNPSGHSSLSTQEPAASRLLPSQSETVSQLPTADVSEKPAGVPRQSDAGRPIELSFDDVKFDLEKGSPFHRELIPPTIEAFEGRRVRIRGYILPSFQQNGLTQFVLVRDNMECCFGPGAALYDCIVVRMNVGTSTSFSIRPVAVTGIFRITELKGPDGNHLAIYSMDGEAVR